MNSTKNIRISLDGVASCVMKLFYCNDYAVIKDFRHPGSILFLESNDAIRMANVLIQG